MNIPPPLAIGFGGLTVDTLFKLMALFLLCDAALTRPEPSDTGMAENDPDEGSSDFFGTKENLSGVHAEHRDMEYWT